MKTISKCCPSPCGSWCCVVWLMLVTALMGASHAAAADPSTREPKAAATQPRAALPFIEVDPASRTCLREHGTGRPFVAVGVNYFDPEVGWAPKLWQQFDATRVRHHLDLIHQAGFNTVRIFLTFQTFHSEPGKVDRAGLEKLRTFLGMCGERDIRVIPTGPDAWEGVPAWRNADQFTDARILDADTRWWTAFAHEMREERAILAYDLWNEPAVPWDTPGLRKRWEERIAAADDLGSGTDIPAPQATEDPGKARRLLAFQRVREQAADTWTRLKVQAIRSVDPNHLITIGHIQWAAPVLLPAIQHYAGFDLRHTADLVDFVSIHFYPLESPMPCQSTEGIAANASYLTALLCEATASGKPVMLGEFGWYGGGAISTNGKITLPDGPVQQQTDWCRRLLEVSRGRLCGWLNWAFADTPTSQDLTRWSGCWTTELRLKPWGALFSEFAHEQARQPEAWRPFPDEFVRANAERARWLTSLEAARKTRLRLQGQAEVSSSSRATRPSR